MAKGDVFEIRITFRQDQEDLYEYIKSHNSSSGFLKDLAAREKLKDENYVKADLEKDNIKIEDVQRLISLYWSTQPMMNASQYNAPQPVVLPQVNNQSLESKNTKNIGNPNLEFSTDDVNVLQRLLEDKESSRS